MVCMMAGSDVIKTSTGKEGVNATFPVALIMLRAIREYFQRTGYRVGFKPAGGIRAAKDALRWGEYVIQCRQVPKNVGPSVVASLAILRKRVLRHPTALHCTLRHCAVLYCAVPCRTAPGCCAVLYYTVLHCTALHCTALHCTALHCTALHCTALHCTALHCTALYWTALHWTALHCTALCCNLYIYWGTVPLLRVMSP